MVAHVDELEPDGAIATPGPGHFAIDASLARLVDWWRTLGGSPPRWEPDHAQALRPWLGNLLIARYNGGGEETARISLYGTLLASLLGEDLTGMTLREAAGHDGANDLLRGYAEARAAARPHWCMVAAGRRTEPDRVYQRLLLPFRNGWEERVMAALVHRRAPAHGKVGIGPVVRIIEARLLN